VALAPRKPITIGVITSGNAGAYTSSLGIAANFGDQRKQAELVAGYLNKQGGILGHQIKLTYYDYDTTAGGPGNAQAACAAFTEDNHAFAAVGVAGMDTAYHACANKRGMLVLTDGDIKAESFFHRYPTTILVSDVALARKYRSMVYGLKDLGFFTPGAKIALLYTDDLDDTEGIRTGMKPALSALGLKVSDEVAVNSTDAGAYYSQMASAVLKFRSAGITHILFGHAAAWTFGQAAEKQGYYPKYGIDSRQSPALLMQGVNSPQTLVNVWGIGYQPVQDVDQANDPGPVSARQRLCTKLFNEGGQASSTRLALASALYLCDQIFFLHDALAAAPDVSLPSFLKGVAGLGSTYQSPLTFATRFSNSQHDGAQGFRPLRFNTQCDCFRYTGPVRLFR
jgi:ABC-type branched-subunit amino acid transport system substrate-binding protein